jgi:hypothetical protein
MGRNNEDFTEGSGVPSSYYRWMHEGEYETARKTGSFKNNINVSDVNSDAYADDNLVQVKFPGGKDAAIKKEDYTGPAGNAYWLKETPFDKGTLIDVGSVELAKKYGFDPSPRQGCLACEHTAPLRHNHTWKK